MGCPDGYYSFKREDAPDRFSLETGIICSLFGASHPLCKWVDEVLPSIPVGDALKDVGKQLAKKIRNKIKHLDWKAIQSAQGDAKAVADILQWKEQIEQVNALIDDVIETMQGGEVSTLEFCLAGVPPFPETVNWGDIFLAFTGVYPDYLLEKVSGIIAYTKYFELCECRKFAWRPDLAPPVEDLYVPPVYDFVLGDNACNPEFTAYVHTQINPINQLARSLNSISAWRARIAQRLWLNATNNTPMSGIPLEGYEFFFCPEEGEGEELRDLLPSVETIELSQCCRLKRRGFIRRYSCPKFDVRFDYTWEGQPTSYWLVNGSYGASPCEGEYGNDQVFWYSIESAENVCYPSPSGSPADLEVKDFPPGLDPCESQFKAQFGDVLCKECDPCEELTVDVRIIRNCEEFIEPRSLYWN